MTAESSKHQKSFFAKRSNFITILIHTTLYHLCQCVFVNKPAIMFKVYLLNMAFSKTEWSINQHKIEGIFIRQNFVEVIFYAKIKLT